MLLFQTLTQLEHIGIDTSTLLTLDNSYSDNEVDDSYDDEAQGACKTSLKTYHQGSQSTSTKKWKALFMSNDFSFHPSSDHQQNACIVGSGEIVHDKSTPSTSSSSVATVPTVVIKNPAPLPEQQTSIAVSVNNVEKKKKKKISRNTRQKRRAKSNSTRNKSRVRSSRGNGLSNAVLEREEKKHKCPPSPKLQRLGNVWRFEI